MEEKGLLTGMPQPAAQDQSPLVLLNAQRAQLAQERDALWEKTGIPDDLDCPAIQTKEALLERIQMLEALEAKFSANFAQRRPAEHVCLRECRAVLQSLDDLEVRIADLEERIAEERVRVSRLRLGAFSIYAPIHAPGAVVGPGGQIGSTINCTFVLGAQEDDEPVSAVPVAERLRKSLQETYKGYMHLERLFDAGNTPIAKSFINLALVKEAEQKSKENGLGRAAGEEKNDGGEDNGREKGKFPAYVDERLASHEQLYAVKEPLELTELFEPKDDAQKPNKVLVLGRAGIGKSILCQYLATQWASEEKEAMPVADCLQKKFEAVFWIKLREIAADATAQDTLVDVLDRFCLSGLEADRPTKKELARYLKQSSDKVLFILDGYDEITEAENLNRILEELSNHTHLLLTSRPIVIEKLGKKPVAFDRRLENMGFLNENIEAYIHQFMTDANQSEQAPLMLNFLKSHAGVWGIAHIPINLELLSWLWSQEELTLEAGQVITLSSLYQIIISSVQDAYVRKALPRPAALPLNAAMEIKSEGSVADHVNIFLENLAFHAMAQETLFISGVSIRTALEGILPKQRYADSQREQLLKSATDKLGFLRSTGKGGKSQLKQTHYFIHLSFQEFYAARYVARVLTDQSRSQEAKKILEQIRTEKYTPRYQLTLWMSAGLLYQQGKKTKQFSQLLHFWRAILSKPRDMIGFYHMVLVMHCLDECEADNQLGLHHALIRQQYEWFQVYMEADYSRWHIYAEQLAQCSILRTSKPMLLQWFQVLLNPNNWKNKAVFEMGFEMLRDLGELDETMTDMLSSALRNRNMHVRRNALTILGNLRNMSERMVPDLLRVLESEEIDVKCQVIRILGHLDNPSEAVIQRLLSILWDQEAAAGEKAVETAVQTLARLNNFQEVGLPDLLHALQDANKRYKAISVLSCLKNPHDIVIQALVNALQDEDREVRKAVYNAYGISGMKDPAVIQAFLSTLKNEDRDVRKEVYDTLVRRISGMQKDPTVVQALLMSALQDADRGVRRQVYALILTQQMENPTVIQVLLNALNDENGYVREEAYSALDEIKYLSSEATIQVFLRALQDENEYLRLVAYDALGKIRDLSSEATIQAFLAALHDKHGYVRRAVIRVLGKLKSPSEAIVQVLLNAAKDKDSDVREAAYNALGRIKNPISQIVIADFLLHILGDENEDEVARREVVEALGNLHNPSDDVIAALLNASNSQNKDIRETAILALVKLNNPSGGVIAVLLNIFQNRDEDTFIRRAAVQALVRLSNQSKEVTAVLRGVLQENEDAFIVRVIARGLQPNFLQVETVILKLQSPSWEVRKQAIKALSKLNSPSENVITALVNALEDTEGGVRREAVEVLIEMNNRSEVIVQYLLDTLQKPRGDVKRAVIDALGLGKLGNLSDIALQALRNALKDEEWRTRVAALSALVRINQPREDIFAVLQGALRDQRADVRGVAVVELGDLNNPSEAVIKALLDTLHDEDRGVWQAAAAVLSNLKTVQQLTIVFEHLTTAKQCAAYFDIWFRKSYLLYIDHQQRQLVARPERQTYRITLPEKQLLYLEKQIIAVARQKHYPLELYSPLGCSDNSAGFFARVRRQLDMLAAPVAVDLRASEGKEEKECLVM